MGGKDYLISCPSLESAGHLASFSRRDAAILKIPILKLIEETVSIVRASSGDGPNPPEYLPVNLAFIRQVRPHAFLNTYGFSNRNQVHCLGR